MSAGMPSFDRALLDAFPGNVAVLDAAGTIAATNRAWEGLTTAHRLAGGTVGMSYLEVCRRSPAPVAAFAGEGVAAVLAGTAPRFDLDYLDPGHRRWFALTITPLAGGGALVAHLDITARKRAEHALRCQNAVLALMADGAPFSRVLEEIAMLVETQHEDLRVAIRLRDRHGLRLVLGVGIEHDDAAALPPGAEACVTAARWGTPIVTEDVREDAVWAPHAAVAKALGIRSSWCMPIVVSPGEVDLGRGERTPSSGVTRPPDGLLGAITAYRATPGRLDEEEAALVSQAAQLSGLAIARTEVLGELRQSEERFRLLVDGIPDSAIFMVDPSGQIVTWNVTAERSYGYGAAEAIGKPASILEAGEAKPWQPAPVTTDREGWQVRKNGERFLASVVTTPLRNEDGTLRGHAKVVRDLTARRRLEEQLWHAQKMEAVGRLAGGIAHDFNNLLTVVKANLDALDEEVASRPGLAEQVAEIVAATDRASGLTRQLLAFSRKQVLDPVVLDLNRVVLGCERLLRRLIGEHVRLRSELAASLPPVLADVGQLEQVMINLAVNARDAMPEGGEVVFTTASHEIDPLGGSGPVVELSVRDTGIGMDDATRARVFEPFFTTKPHGHGTGLGLSVVYGIVEQSGGRIVVESGPGEGACFRITLPARAASERHSVPVPAAPEARRGRERVLLVEDEELVRRSLVRALSRHGYEVVEADGAGTALAELGVPGRPIDLLVTDVVMPGMSGPRLVETVRQLHPELRVLFVSGYTDDLVPLLGQDAFLQKPFSPGVLLDKVRSILDATRLDSVTDAMSEVTGRRSSR